MTITLQTTQRSITALFLVLGLMIQMSTVSAQSRGNTSGRKSSTERTEKKSSSSSAKNATPQSRSSQSRGSNARASESSRRGNSRGSSRQQAKQSQKSSSSSNNGRSSASRQRATDSNRSGTTSRGASRNRTNKKGSTAKSPQQNSGRSTANRGGQSGNSSRASGQRSENSGRSTANRGSRSSNGSSVRNNDQSNTRQGNSRSDNSGRSSANRGSRSENGSRAGSSRGGSSRQGNNGRSTVNREQLPDDDARNNRGRQRNERSNATRERGDDSARRENNTRNRNTDRSAGNRGNSNTNQRNRAVNNGRRETNGRTTVNPRSNGRRYGSRRDATNVRVLPAPNYGWRDARKHQVYKNRAWRYKNNRVYVNPVYHHRPHVSVNVVWPWQNRYRRNWRPSYRYCQVVYVESNWGGRRHRAAVDIRTNYHHEVRYADQNKAVVDIYLDEIEVYEEGYYLGKVRRFPRDLEHIEATIYRNGEVVYDRDVFVIGDSRSGFELISTRHYDGYVLNRYDRSHGMEVGKLNFRRKRVDSRRYSRLFDPYDYNGYTPISVLPDDEQLLDYGYDAISYHHYDENYDPYYGGSYNDDYYDYDNYGNYSVYEAPGGGHGNGFRRDQLSNEVFVTEAQPLTLNRTQTYNTRQGVDIKLQREATLERLK